MSTQSQTLPPAPIQSPSSDASYILLIAPSVSERMGGEAIKALQIYQELDRQGLNVHQLTHDRVRFEIRDKFPNMRITYIPDFWDDSVQRFILKWRLTRPLNTLVFYWRAAQYIRRLAPLQPNLIVHYTSPISPVLPAFHVKGVPTIMGPLNGNIHYPPALRHREPRSFRLRRLFHIPSQLFHRLFFRGRQRANILLVAGGQRTEKSLRWAGCKKKQFVPCLDCGVLDTLLSHPRIEHHNTNFEFLYTGRLVPYKGVDLILQALPKTKNPIRLTIVGTDPSTTNLPQLVTQLNLTDRVRFLPWIENHDQFAQFLRPFRAFVSPALAEANGIVVQESMAIGLPVICVNWGGPALLVTPSSGIAIEPKSESYIIDQLAQAMDKLAENPELADQMSQTARNLALQKGFSWTQLIQTWIPLYHRLHQQKQSAVHK